MDTLEFLDWLSDDALHDVGLESVDADVNDSLNIRMELVVQVRPTVALAIQTPLPIQSKHTS
eukprot:677964-Amphidinium_carterae.2